ncbi:MAG: DUF4367 domain-containing protein [Candidatus Microsaccharimonas sp.]
MQANKTVTINGRTYDAVTGLPVQKKSTPAVKPTKPTPAAAKRADHVPAASVHTTTQRSQTLHRRATKKPASLAKRPQAGRHMDISRSKSISRFAPHPAAVTAKKPSTPDVPVRPHPAAARALARTSTNTKPATKSSKQIKDAAISAALSTPTQKPIKQKRFKWQWSRRFTIITAIFALLIIGATITYANLPVLSVGFAAAQSGINATYPEYRPDGYSLSQPVTFRDGEVSLTFKSNTSDSGYTITQTRSSWDSTAVLDNVVRKDAGDDYTTTQEKGLIIYAYDENTVATWVNGGILYKIKTTAPLSGEQIRRIATSL